MRNYQATPSNLHHHNLIPGSSERLLVFAGVGRVEKSVIAFIRGVLAYSMLSGGAYRA